MVAQITESRSGKPFRMRYSMPLDEVELADLTPDDLLRSWLAGKVYFLSRPRGPAKNSSGKGNLIALRELALRR